VVKKRFVRIDADKHLDPHVSAAPAGRRSATSPAIALTVYGSAADRRQILGRCSGRTSRSRSSRATGGRRGDDGLHGRHEL